ncbi:hypothetical protein J6590_101931 [Homalodisca vitripennis]|nr:hypothetical protein J6590_101931 [Homalodisca vitripennis]
MFIELVKLTNSMVVVIPDLGVPQRFARSNHMGFLRSPEAVNNPLNCFRWVALNDYGVNCCYLEFRNLIRP